MKFEKHFPSERLKPYIKYFVISESEIENEYKVFPSTGLVIGSQYKGKLAMLQANKQNELDTAGITGISDSYRIFKNSANIGTLLVYFTEIGFTQFATAPANELFNLSLSLEDTFSKSSVMEVSEKLATAPTDKLRIEIIEQFLIANLKDVQTDKLIVEAVKLIHQSKGTIRIMELNEKLGVSQSPFEKRFRKVVGTSAKRFASIVRFNTVLDNLNKAKTLTEICYENNFFDQAHFSKDFKQFTGESPENFKRTI